MAVANMSAGYQYTVYPFQESPEQEAVIHSAGAHQTDQTHMGYTGQIGSGISTPVADKG